MNRVDDLTEQFGQSNPETVFFNLSSYAEFQQAMIEFLNGRIIRNPWYGASIDKETIPLMDDLIAINSYGFVSTQGQPAQNNIEFIPRTWVIEGKVQGNWYVQTQQKPFIQGFLEGKFLRSFMTFMKSQRGYYYNVYDINSKLIISTFPGYPYNITRQRSNKVKSKLRYTKWDYYSNIFSDSGFDPDQNLDTYPNLLSILRDSVLITIAGDTYGKGSCEKLLLKFFQRD